MHEFLVHYKILYGETQPVCVKRMYVRYHLYTVNLESQWTHRTHKLVTLGEHLLGFFACLVVLPLINCYHLVFDM